MLCCYASSSYGISRCWLLVLSCPPKQSHHPVNRHQGGNSGLVVGQSWKAFLLHMGSFDSTSVVIFSLDFDRCRNSVKGQSRCLCACSSRTWTVSWGVSAENGSHSTWHKNTGSSPKRESAMKQASIPRQEVATDHRHRCLLSHWHETSFKKNNNIPLLLKIFRHAGSVGGPPCQTNLNTVLIAS